MEQIFDLDDDILKELIPLVGPRLRLKTKIKETKEKVYLIDMLLK